MYTNLFYNKFAKKIYSGNGEDGIVEELFKRLDITIGWVCEFGAWDGIVGSNTFALVEKGFKAVYIEGDKNKYNDLLVNVNKYSNIIPVNKYVDHNNTNNSLDNILNDTDIPKDFDLLSIDIDSYDYHIWKSLVNYKPKIVIIEINSSVNTNEENAIYGEYTPKQGDGSGFLPMFKLGKEKGYTFLLHTGNMFFIRNDLYEKVNIKYSNPLENFRTNWGGK